VINHSGTPLRPAQFWTQVGVASAMREGGRELARNTLSGAISASFPGRGPRRIKHLHRPGALLTLTILVIYVLLGILYESFNPPLTILSGLPAAGLGAILR